MIGRRAAIAKGAASMFGLGRTTPSRFPYADRPQSPGAGPGQSNILRARLVLVTGPSGTISGVFVYRPGTTPGPGNPPASWLTNSPTDPYGNAIPAPGPGSQSPTGAWAALNNGTLQLSVAGVASTLSGVLSETAAGNLSIGSGLVSVGDGQANLALMSTLASGGTGPVTQVAAGAFQSTLGTPSNPTKVTTDVRNLATLKNGWTGTLYYWQNPDFTISVAGSINPAAMTSTICATIPYTPPVAFDFGVAAHTSTPPTQGVFSRLQTTGDVNIINSTVGSGQMGVAITGVPLF